MASVFKLQPVNMEFRTVFFIEISKKVIKSKKEGQTALTEEDEKPLLGRLIICSDWANSIYPWTLRILIKKSLDWQGRTIKKLKDNIPGWDFVYFFLNRDKADLLSRLCQNIKRARASITPEMINEYFDR